METALDTPVSLTNGAVSEIKRLMNEESFDHSQLLRVGVKGGGCSGMTYILGFDHKQEGDEEFEIGDIRCIMKNAHGIYLMGMEVDFQAV